VVYFDRERALADLGLPSEINSSPNVGFVRSIVEDWERGDFSSAQWAHPEIEFEIVGGPSPGSWRGLRGMAQGWRGFLSAWEEFHSVVDEYRELDGERVIVLAHRTGRGKMSGLELEHVKTMTGTVFHLHNGQVTRLVVYFDSNRALADLGLLSEADASGS
jgi:ketosteroid isomerase-like protein